MPHKIYVAKCYVKVFALTGDHLLYSENVTQNR